MVMGMGIVMDTILLRHVIATVNVIDTILQMTRKGKSND